MSRTETPRRPLGRGESWIARGCAVIVAGVAAYSSYAHQRDFALDGGADPITAALWPLSVDGLVILASIGLLRLDSEATRRTRWAVHTAFLLGVIVSLAANVAAAPALEWQPIVVAGWPPLALLLGIELILHARHHRHIEISQSRPIADADGATIGEAQPADETTGSGGETNCRGTYIEAAAESDGNAGDGVRAATRGGSAALVSVTAPLSSRSGGRRRGGAEGVMWSYYQRAIADGHTPTGADLDRIAGTSNYGRAVLARWRRQGRVPPAA